MSVRVLVRSKGGNRPLVIYWIDSAGREHGKSAGTRDRREAERAAAVWQEELIAFRGSNDSSWELFVERFENEHLVTLSKATRNNHITALNHFHRLTGVDDVASVDGGMVSQFQAAMLQEKYRGKLRPVTTVATYLNHLRGAFKWAERVGIIRKSPVIRLPRVGRRRMMRGRPLTEAEYKTMRAKARADLARFLDLLWLSGLRIEEAARLSWDLPPVSIHLDAKPYPLIVFYAEGHKAGEDDALPLAPDFTEWLRKTPADQRTGLVAPVINNLGRPKPPHKIGLLITELGQTCVITVNDAGKFASAHDFRRSFGTRWASKVRPVTLQRLMRHKSIETTLKYYIGLTAADAGAELWMPYTNTASSSAISSADAQT